VLAQSIYIPALEREIRVPAYTVEQGLGRQMILVACETREQVLAFLADWKQKDLEKWEKAKKELRE